MPLQGCTTCKGFRVKDIRVHIHFGPFAPGICDDCAEAMAKAMMDSKYSLPQEKPQWDEAKASDSYIGKLAITQDNYIKYLRGLIGLPGPMIGKEFQAKIEWIKDKVDWHIYYVKR